jgi:4-amino-4-deoxy-L-arabinose transferase-like glycosyltransferase
LARHDAGAIIAAMKHQVLKWRSNGVLFLLALTARLIPVFFSLDLGIALDDMYQYDALAESIRLGQGFTWYGGIPTAARAPLYPLFLAVLYTLLGHHFAVARTAQAVLGAFVPLMVHTLGRRLFDSRVGIAAALIVALYPMFLLYPLGLATENLFFLLVPATILCLCKAAERSHQGFFLLAGVLLGLTILTRSVITGFLVLLLPWLWWYSADKREALKSWILVLVPVAVLTIPWSIRNTLLYHELVFVESSMGFNFYLGYHPEGTGTFDSDIAVEFLDEIGAFNEPNLDTEKASHNLGMERGLGFIRDDPVRAAWLVLSKLSHLLRLDKRVLLYFYSNDFLGELPPLVLLLTFLVICTPWVVVLLLSVPGMVMSALTRDKTLVYLLLVYLVGIHVLIMAEPRFHLVMVPFLAVFAAQGVRALRSASGDLRDSDAVVRRNARWGLALTAALIALLLVNWAYELNVDLDKLRLLFSPGGNTARFTY